MIVLKLGGSLLSLPDLASRIKQVLTLRPDGRFAMVVGGGAAAELVRDWDRAHHLGAEAAHQLALRAMRLNADLITRLLSTARVVADPHGLDSACAAGALPLVDVGAWLSDAEAAGRATVPHTWQATSDSIAAWFAGERDAAELILLKSIPQPGGDLQRAITDGSIDAHFPDAAVRVRRISWVNLRAVDGLIEPWILDGEMRHGEHRS